MHFYILGDMYELGQDAPKLHKELGEFVSGQGIRKVVYIGEYADSFSDGFGEKLEKYKTSSD